MTFRTYLPSKSTCFSLSYAQRLNEPFSPIFIVGNVLLSAAPVALTLAQMSTKTGASDLFEKQLSSTIFWSYVVALTPTTIIYVVIALILAKM